MIVSTLLPAIALLAALYFFAIRFIPWKLVSYGVVLVIGIPFLLAKAVHLHYIGIDVTVIGLFLVWCHDRYQQWRKSKAEPPA